MSTVERYALIDADGVVQNVILWNGDHETWQAPDDVTVILERDLPARAVEPGGIVDGEEYTPPIIEEGV